TVRSSRSLHANATTYCAARRRRRPHVRSAEPHSSDLARSSIKCQTNREALMRKSITAALLASAALAAAGDVSAQGQAQTLVIQGGTLIDGNRGAPVAHCV